MQKKRLVIKGPSGFGDAIYLNPIAHALSKEHDLVVQTKYPELFRDIDCKTVLESSHRDKYCTYINNKMGKNSQFNDMVANAGLSNIELKLHLDLKPSKNIVDLVQRKKPYAVAVNPYREHIITDCRLMPEQKQYSKMVYEYVGLDIGLIVVGKSPQNLMFNGISLLDNTTQDDLLYIIKNAEKTIGQVGYIIPASEVFDVPCLAVFAIGYKHSTKEFVKTIKPHKVITKSTTKTVYEKA